MSDEEFMVIEPEETLPEVDIESLVPRESSLDEILSGKARVGWKPDISGLPDAVADGKLLVPPGGQLLIEYTDSPWRDTTCWIVSAIEPEGIAPKGYIRLYDPNRMQYGCTNVIDGLARGLVFKIPDGSRKWLPGEEEDMRHRRRRRVAAEVAPTPKPVEVGSDGQPVKKKRGRPKGSKNRSTLIKEAQQRLDEMKKIAKAS